MAERLPRFFIFFTLALAIPLCNKAITVLWYVVYTLYIILSCLISSFNLFLVIGSHYCWMIRELYPLSVLTTISTPYLPSSCFFASSSNSCGATDNCALPHLTQPLKHLPHPALPCQLIIVLNSSTDLSSYTVSCPDFAISSLLIQPFPHQPPGHCVNLHCVLLTQGCHHQLI